MAKTDSIMVREWDADTFHKRVLELEKKGYVTRLDSYKITAEMNPENGIVSHVHTIEMYKANESR